MQRAQAPVHRFERFPALCSVVERFKSFLGTPRACGRGIFFEHF